MARAKRHILYLNPHFGPERDAIQLLNAVPQGEGGAFLRAVAAIGRQAMLQDKAKEARAATRVAKGEEEAHGAD